jgi:hypothetical protein
MGEAQPMPVHAVKHRTTGDTGGSARTRSSSAHKGQAPPARAAALWGPGALHRRTGGWFRSGFGFYAASACLAKRPAGHVRGAGSCLELWWVWVLVHALGARRTSGATREALLPSGPHAPTALVFSTGIHRFCLGPRS